MENDCIVHNRKSRSIFHQNINKIRQTNEFHPSVLQKLPKRCCSCDDQTGESSLTIYYLHKLCKEIQSFEKQPLKRKCEPLKIIHYLIVYFPLNYSNLQHQYKTGRFVGSKGKNLQRIEQKLHISIHILNNKSSIELQKRTEEIRRKNQSRNYQDLILFFTINNNNNQINNVQQIQRSIQFEWNNIHIRTEKEKEKVFDKELEKEMNLSFLLEKDSRWKRKK
ncbi:hypothetical protein I4U23_010716 [Adineta vaga]|nr:hypothetical protein I4U23_010716 [Adineta vaga]